jgi:hypothetical protein
MNNLHECLLLYRIIYIGLNCGEDAAKSCLVRSQLQKMIIYVLRRLVELKEMSPLQQLHAFLEAFTASFAYLYEPLNKEKI